MFDTIIEDVAKRTKVMFPLSALSLGSVGAGTGEHPRKGAAMPRNLFAFKHGKVKTSAYRVWSGMIQRCTNKNNPAYGDYGGRGIRVCDRWRESFQNFYADMGDRPAGKSLDRIDNNGDYCPENCRWATHLEQHNNSRANVKIGDLTMADYCRKHGLDYSSFRGMYKTRGRTLEDATRRAAKSK